MVTVLGLRASHNTLGWAELSVQDDRSLILNDMDRINFSSHDSLYQFSKLLGKAEERWKNFDGPIVRETVFRSGNSMAHIGRLNGFLDLVFTMFGRGMKNFSTPTVRKVVSGYGRTSQWEVNDIAGEYLRIPVTVENELSLYHELAASSVAITYLLKNDFINSI